MKTWIIILTIASLAFHARGADNAVKEEMRLKLFYSQSILEGIATENFTLISTNAYTLKNFSERAVWDVRQAPEYRRLTTDFRRDVDSLSRAAERRSVDAATVALLSTDYELCHVPQVFAWSGSKPGAMFLQSACSGAKNGDGSPIPVKRTEERRPRLSAA